MIFGVDLTLIVFLATAAAIGVFALIVWRRNNP